MSFYTPPVFLNPDPALASTSPKVPQAEQMLHNAETAEDYLVLGETLAGSPRLTDQEAQLLAEAPESNTGIVGSAQKRALAENEAAQGFSYANPTGDERSINDVAAHLSAKEIGSANGQAILLAAHQFLKTIGSETATSAAKEAAKKAFDDLVTELEDGAALTEAFVSRFATLAIEIVTYAAMHTNNQFIGFFDPYDSSNQRQIAQTITTDGAMQDSE